ncbi:MAG: Ribosomal small subunit methyltransferase [Planctomycetota bacterium]|jgi:16S rRNA (cytosine1402-N4)-methyltransferase
MSAPRPPVHIPVMPREVLHWLQLSPNLTVLDGTVGAAGHSAQILKQLGPAGRLIGIDRDPSMLRHAAARLEDPRVTLVNASYSEAERVLRELQIGGVDRVLLDLGLSSDQLADEERGFGFDAGGPLDMRFNPEVGRPAALLLQESSAEELEQIFRTWGEEAAAGRIAAAIIHRRRLGRPPQTASELLECVGEVCGPLRSDAGRSAAARVFQSLRIAVNQELQHVESMLTEVLPRILLPGGIAVIISFHSLEDRIVKHALKGNHGWQLLTKTPVEAMPAEIRINPRSRPAKLRAARWQAAP